MVGLFSTGLSVNYVVLEIIGVLYSFTYMIFGYLYNPNYNSTGEINIWSVIFAATSVSMCSIQVIVLSYYPRFVNWVKPVWMFLAVAAILSVLTFASVKPEPLDIVVFMGLMRLIINTIKFFPQLYLNWLRKSTEGWSITGVYADLGANALYLVRIIVDSIERQKFDQFSTNLGFGIFILAQVAIGCDVLFICQHVVSEKDARLYSEHSETASSGGEAARAYDGLDSGRTTHDKEKLKQISADLRATE